MKHTILLIFSFITFSCSQINEKKDNNIGIIKNDDQKSLIIEKLADSNLKMGLLLNKSIANNSSDSVLVKEYKKS